jgi:uroporphyrin-III C-methyltransferase
MSELELASRARDVPIDRTDSPRDRALGRVDFVGAGPGDPDLLTVRALRSLQAAEVVLHDALVGEAILALAPQARLIAVGKRAHRPSTAQRFINRSLVHCAQRYSRVVRLKGGDPGVFGRLEEEIAALRAAGITYGVVPGVSAAFAAAASLGAPLTERGVARSLTLLTARVGEGEAAHDWARPAVASGSTLALYMAGRTLTQTAADLIAAGLAVSTPLAVVAAAATPQEQRWVGTLASAAHCPIHPEHGPVMLLVGEALRHARVGPGEIAVAGNAVEAATLVRAA